MIKQGRVQMQTINSYWHMQSQEELRCAEGLMDWKSLRRAKMQGMNDVNNLLQSYNIVVVQARTG